MKSRKYNKFRKNRKKTQKKIYKKTEKKVNKKKHNRKKTYRKKGGAKELCLERSDSNPSERFGPEIALEEKCNKYYFGQYNTKKNNFDYYAWRNPNNKFRKNNKITNCRLVDNYRKYKPCPENVRIKEEDLDRQKQEEAERELEEQRQQQEELRRHEETRRQELRRQQPSSELSEPEKRWLAQEKQRSQKEKQRSRKGKQSENYKRSSINSLTGKPIKQSKQIKSTKITETSEASEASPSNSEFIPYEYRDFDFDAY